MALRVCIITALLTTVAAQRYVRGVHETTRPHTRDAPKYSAPTYSAAAYTPNAPAYRGVFLFSTGGQPQPQPQLQPQPAQHYHHDQAEEGTSYSQSVMEPSYEGLDAEQARPAYNAATYKKPADKTYYKRQENPVARAAPNDKEAPAKTSSYQEGQGHEAQGQYDSSSGSETYSQPKEESSKSGYSSSSYNAPAAPSYSAPASSYSAAAPSYSAPAPSYSSGAPSYSAAGPSYSAAGPSYSAAAPSYSAAAPSYKQPPTYEGKTYTASAYKQPAAKAPSYNGGYTDGAYDDAYKTDDDPPPPQVSYTAPTYNAPSYNVHSYNAPTYNAPLSVPAYSATPYKGYGAKIAVASTYQSQTGNKGTYSAPSYKTPKGPSYYGKNDTGYGYDAGTQTSDYGTSYIQSDGDYDGQAPVSINVPQYIAPVYKALVEVFNGKTGAALAYKTQPPNIESYNAPSYKRSPAPKARVFYNGQTGPQPVHDAPADAHPTVGGFDPNPGSHSILFTIDSNKK